MLLAGSGKKALIAQCFFLEKADADYKMVDFSFYVFTSFDPMSHSPQQQEQAAAILHDLWLQKNRFVGLPEALKPVDRAEGYAIQAAFSRLNKQAVFGWKIAATSVDGQRHIGVDGPLAGRLFADRILPDGALVSLERNLMQVAEIEFAFRFARSLAPRAEEYTVDEVLAAVGTVHPSIEIPDSRYADFVTAGAPQLIADLACANLFVLGPAAEQWANFDFIDAEIPVMQNGAPVNSGYGRNVLGDPRVALTWLVNELSRHGMVCEAGQAVTTGTCRIPVAVKPGDDISADFGVLGRVHCRFGQ